MSSSSLVPINSSEAEAETETETEKEKLEKVEKVDKAVDVDKSEEKKEGVEDPNPNPSPTGAERVHLRELVPALHKRLSKGDYHEKTIMNELQSLLERYDEKFGDWKRFALAEEDPTKYSRNLIARNSHFTLMLLCWPPNSGSPIHNHGGSECWLRVVQGTLEERLYEKPEEKSPLVRKAVTKHTSPGVCFINDGMGLHAVANPSKTEMAVSLHCYVPGFDVCTGYVDEECSDKKKQCPMKFTSIDGVRVEH